MLLKMLLLVLLSDYQQNGIGTFENQEGVIVTFLLLMLVFKAEASLEERVVLLFGIFNLFF